MSDYMYSHHPFPLMSFFFTYLKKLKVYHFENGVAEHAVNTILGAVVHRIISAISTPDNILEVPDLCN